MPKDENAPENEMEEYDTVKKFRVGYLSGTFDLFHVGHIRLLRRAKELCGTLIVGVNENGVRKGKETFIPLEERLEVVAACRYADVVIPAPPEDDMAWEMLHYDVLFAGSDYIGSERFKRYESTLADKNVKIIFFEYTQTTSSSIIRERIGREV